MAQQDLVAWISGWSPVAHQLAALGVTVIGALVVEYLRPKVRIMWGTAGNAFNTLPTGTSSLSIYHQKLYIQNLGRGKAESIDIACDGKPDSYSLFPSRSTTLTQIPGTNKYLITLPYIAPRELVIFDFVSIAGSMRPIESVSVSNGRIHQRQLWIVRRYSASVNWLLLLLMIAGLAFIVQLLFYLLL